MQATAQKFGVIWAHLFDQKYSLKTQYGEILQNSSFLF